MPTVYIDSADILGDVDDDDLVREVSSRGLIADVLRTVGKDPPKQTSDLVRDALSHLISKRGERARTAMADLIAAFIPAEVWEAHCLIEIGDYNAAIIELDKFLEPAPSATVSKLPARPQGEGE